jgi:hypothetical protein
VDRTVVFILLWGVLLALGFLAGLAIGREWTRWVVGGFVAGFYVAMKGSHPGELLVAIPYIVGLAVLGYGVATLGIRLRRTLTHRRYDS